MVMILIRKAAMSRLHDGCKVQGKQVATPRIGAGERSPALCGALAGCGDAACHDGSLLALIKVGIERLTPASRRQDAM